MKIYVVSIDYEGNTFNLYFQEPVTKEKLENTLIRKYNQAKKDDPRGDFWDQFAYQNTLKNIDKIDVKGFCFFGKDLRVSFKQIETED